MTYIFSKQKKARFRGLFRNALNNSNRVPNTESIR